MYPNYHKAGNVRGRYVLWNDAIINGYSFAEFNLTFGTAPCRAHPHMIIMADVTK